MKYKLIIFILLVFPLRQSLLGQSETYTIEKASFSSDSNDEFSPVYYKNGIVFCTNHSTSLSDYSTSNNEKFFKIYYIDTTGKAMGQRAKLFSKVLTTKLNDGPVTFNRSGDTIYYSRNLVVKGKLSNLSSSRNKLGIFSAVQEGKKWTKIRELRLNNEWYNITTPYLSPEGTRLYFASDKPDGYGGSDLYYSQWKDDYWDNPVNLGPVINSSGNESYPFINPSGELFFSSDGHPGLGGKDIFFSRFEDNEWLTPVRLDPPINSKHDDFGIITDTLMNEGYFSSNRDKSIDIFHFTTNFSQIFYSSIQKENQYCFIFNDSGSIVVDTAYLQYKWDFGDGKTASGPIVNHCFPGPGNYNVRLEVIDRGTGKLFFTKLSYNLRLMDFEQPYINSPEIAVNGDAVEFDGIKSFVPGFTILSYSWDFGDGSRMQGDKVQYTYKEKGEYLVNLGLTLRADSTGKIHKTGVSKKISIFNDQQEKGSYLIEKASEKPVFPDIRYYNNAIITSRYSAETEFQTDAIFIIELLSSKTKIDVNSSIFRNIPQKYPIKESFNPDDSTYSYIADHQMSLMATYPAFMDIVGRGYKDARIKLNIITDPVEKALNNIKKNYGILADTYFDNYGRLTANAYLFLDQIVILMNRNPDIRLEVGVHTDNLGLAANNLKISQTRAQLIVNYLINRGVSNKRLVSKGYGGTKPVALNILEKDRKLNRRVEVIVIN